MSYFEDNYGRLSLPFSTRGGPGLRAAQIAAAQAVAAHFFSHRDPAIVVMPTGSGKSGVMLLVAFLLRAKRVLVITPSRMLREQVSENFSSLSVLIKSGAIGSTTPGPKVELIQSRVSSPEEWERFREADVVVATVASASPAIADIPPPPPDLFDLVLCDEAHHAPAPTWKELLSSFPGAKQALFTATPFRRDEKTLRGRLIFDYPLARAREDGIFGRLQYTPVVPDPGQDHDLAIALAAEARLQADRRAGLKHLLMVRTSQKSRAEQLARLYEERTGLRLRTVFGHHSPKRLKQTIKDMEADDLDGVICVDMLGEGFDLPRLKVAALHSPHRSLGITLQFIGRFARTSSPNLGTATFLAVPTDIESEASQLYTVGAEWNEIVEEASRQRIESERDAREVIATFRDASPTPLGDGGDEIDLLSISPYFHVKVFEVSGPVDLSRQLNVSGVGVPILYRRSDEHRALICVTRKVEQCKWSSEERLSDVSHDLFVVFHTDETGHLFVCSTRRENATYDEITASLAPGRAKRLSPLELNRVLRDVGNASFFSVGMRHRSGFGLGESYRMIAGRSADHAIQRSDGRFYDQGHCFGKGVEAGEEITIGFSSASKVWANRWGRLPELFSWCQRLAKKLADAREVVTNSGLDHLPKARRLEKFPEHLIGAEWNEELFVRTELRLRFLADDGRPSGTAFPLLDANVRILATADEEIAFAVDHDGDEARFTYRFDRSPMIASTAGRAEVLFDSTGARPMELGAFLNDAPPAFFSMDMARVQGDEISGASNAGNTLFDERNVEAVDWIAAGTDYFKEKPTPGTADSLFEWVQRRLERSATVIFNDDGSGEAADFVGLRPVRPDLTEVELYHCKAARGDPVPGQRIDDLYDVVGQAVKSARVTRADLLRTHLLRRMTSTGSGGNRLIRGTRADIESLLANGVVARFTIFIVQPGISPAPGRDQSALLAAAAAFLAGPHVDALKVIGSRAR